VDQGLAELLVKRIGDQEHRRLGRDLQGGDRGQAGVEERQDRVRRGPRVLQDERREHPQVGIEHKEGGRVGCARTIRGPHRPLGVGKDQEAARASGENLRGHRRGATLHREERDGAVGAVGEGLSEAQQVVHPRGVIEEEDRGSPTRLGVETGRRAILAGQDKIRSSLTSAERSRRGRHGCPLHVACIGVWTRWVKAPTIRS
jgi:hypothetical protein